MSLNFPTAFWKTHVPVAEDLTILWVTDLAQSYEDNGTTPAAEFSFPIGNSYDLPNHNYPFTVTDESYEGFEDFYYQYDDFTWQGDPSYEADPPSSDTPYFGWYRNGGTDTEKNVFDLSPGYHKSNPWIIDGFGRPNELHLFFEADLATANNDGWYFDDVNWNEQHPVGIFNNFIQSGNATGTFDIAPSQVGKDLVIKVSGLGEDAEYLVGAQNYDAMRLYLERPDESNNFICSGCAPMDDRNTTDLDPVVSDNFDVQQVKLYTGSNIYSPANSDPANETGPDTTLSPVGWSQFGNGGDEEAHGVGSEKTTTTYDSQLTRYWGSNLVSGAIRANPTQRINQNTRTTYTTSAGVGTFTATDLQLGEHKIKIDVSSVDGTWNSGAFYGFHFTLVD
jgi:hypothetical protein